MSKAFIVCIKIIALLLGCVKGVSQPFYPYLDHYPYSLYSKDLSESISKQNYRSIQDDAGVLFTSAFEYVMQFDGRRWILLKESKTLRKASFAKNSAGKIFVLGESNFGYIGKSDIGQEYSFVSLKGSIQNTSHAATPYQNLLYLEDFIAFHDANSIYIWDEGKGEMKIIPTPFTTISSLIVHKNSLVLLSSEGELFKYDFNSFEKLAPKAPQLSQLKAVHLLSSGNDIWAFVEGKGIYTFQKEEWEQENVGLSELVERATITQLGLIQDGSIAISTLTDGFILADKELNILEKIDSKRGNLSTNAVNGFYQDKEDGIWLDLNDGLSRLSYPPKLEKYSREFGLGTQVLSVVKWKTHLFVGMHGAELRYTKIGENLIDVPDFVALEFPEKVHDIWDLKVFKGKLFIASSRGVFVLEEIGQSPKKISPSGLVFTLFKGSCDEDALYMGWKPLDKNPAEYYVGKISFENAQLQIDPYWQETEHEVRDIEELICGEMWAGFMDLSLININKEKRDIAAIRHFELEEAEKKSHGFIQFFVHDKQLYFGSRRGIMSYDEKADTLAQVQKFGEDFFKRNASAYAAIEDKQGGLWLSIVDRIQYLPTGDINTSDWEIGKFSSLPYVYYIYPEDEENVWFAAADGLYHYRPQISKDYSTPFKALLREVKVTYDAVKERELEDQERPDKKPPEIIKKDSIIFSGLFALDENGYQTIPSPNFELNLPFKYKNISFRFGAGTYEFPERTLFSYQLEGYYPYWSDWDKEHEFSFPYLEEGAYTMKVKARNIYGIESEVISYPFYIQPPWYRSWWAYLLYFLAAAGIIFSVYNFYKNKDQLKQQAKELERERETQRRLLAIDKLKDQFLANTSHELKTPLHGIIGIAESLQDGAGGELNSVLQKNLDMIVSSGKRLSSLVNDLLDFSRIKNRDLNLHKKAVGLFPVVQIVMEACQTLIQGKDLKLINESDPDLPLLFVDENRLQQVLYNLVGNAIKFTEVGEIQVGSRQEVDKIIVSVRDTGTGVPKEKQESIFQEFEQLDGGSERQFAGTGLGLSISKRLVEMHGGEMWLESEIGEGSTFFFSIPMADSEHTPIAQQEKSSLAEKTHFSPPELTEVLSEDDALVREGKETITTKTDSPSVRILVVDDEPINQQVLRNMLTVRNFEIVSAMNGEEALKILDENPDFDMVLLDVMMPRMSGYEVCRRIREKYLPSELPVLMVTAKDQISDKVNGLNSGANDYLSKPFDKEEFLARLETHLNLHRINTATGRFVPSAFLRALGHERITDVYLGDHKEKEVTVFFSDIRGYTSLAETMTPQENFLFVNKYSQIMGPIIEANNGFVNQYLGDGIMAIFLDSPEDGLKASIEMQKAIQAFNLQQTKNKKPKIRVGMGLHTGSLIMGIIGDHKRNDAATISDTVNSAARVEGLTKYYGAKILISGQSLDQLSNLDQYNYRFMGKVQVKGKQESISIYEFFDGDKKEVLEGKIASKEQFSKALKLYFSREFESAIKELEEIISVNPEDMGAKHLLDKAMMNLKEGIPENWDGIDLMETK
ncbi:MAG: response regulator [Bacteroidia bacterium]|nr:response regulator [Bacteroidia bacterium]